MVLTFQFVDRDVATYFYQLNTRHTIPALKILTGIANWHIYSALFFVLGIYFHFISKNAVYAARAWYLLGCVVLPNLLCLVLKMSFGRARPELLVNSHLFGFYWFKSKYLYWSFPSGHTMTIAALASGLGVIFPRYFYLLLGAALVIASSRIVLYYHFVTDVMAGFYLSLLLIGLYTKLLKKKQYW